MDPIYVMNQIKKEEFILNNPIHSHENDPEFDIMIRRSTQVRKSFRHSQLNQDRARFAYKKINKFQGTSFVLQASSHKFEALPAKENSLFSVDLFKKCQFLLVKCAYVIIKDLHKILLFGVHTQGNIMIPKADFIELIDETKVTNNQKEFKRRSESSL